MASDTDRIVGNYVSSSAGDITANWDASLHQTGGGGAGLSGTLIIVLTDEDFLSGIGTWQIESTAGVWIN